VTYSGLISFFAGLLNIGSGLIFTTIITRTLEPEQFGTWNVISGLLIYSVVFDSIISYWSTRETARGINSGRTAIFGNSLLSIVGIGIYFVSGFLFGSYSFIDISFIILAAILIPLRYIQKSISGINNAHKPHVVNTSLLVSEICKVPLGYIFVFQLELGIVGIILAFFGSHIINIIIQLFFAKEKLLENIQRKYVRKWLEFSWLSLYPRIGTLLFRTDVIVFPLIINSVIGVAFFSASLVIANIVNFATAMAAGSYGKLLGGDKNKFIRINFTHTIYVSIPLLALSLGFAKPALFILNPEYQIAIFVVILLSFRMFLYSINAVLSQYLSGAEKVDTGKFTLKQIISSKLFVIPTWNLIQNTGFIIILVSMLLVMKMSDTSEIKLVEFWALIGLITQLPLTIYLIRKAKDEFGKLCYEKSVVKYILGGIISFVVLFELQNNFLVYVNDLTYFVLNTFGYALIGISTYIGITYLIDLKIRELINEIIKRIIR